MRKILDKPITWGEYLTLCMIAIIIGIISTIPYLKWLGFDWKDCLPKKWRKKEE